jgi:hypothetical protein
MSAYAHFLPTANALLLRLATPSVRWDCPLDIRSTPRSASLSQRREIQPNTSMSNNKHKARGLRRQVKTRAPGMTQISISLPEGLVSKIDAMADTENRNRSNFIATVLDDLSEQRRLKAPPPLRAVV